MIAVPASGSFSQAVAFVRSSGERFLPRTKLSGKIPSSIRFSPSTFPPKRLSNLQVRAARAESSVASLGSRAPYFELPEPLTGKVWKLDDFESYPALLDGPKFMAEEAKLLNYPFPYLFDESQDVARAFGAVCTPEFFLYRKDGRRPFELFYHGQFDDSRPNSNIPITGRDLSLAIDSVLSAQQLIAVQKPSVGCSIKWHPDKRK